MTAAIEIAEKKVAENRIMLRRDATCWLEVNNTIRQKIAMAKDKSEKTGTMPQGERTAVVMLMGRMTVHQEVRERMMRR